MHKPFVLAALEDFELAVAAGGLVGRREFRLDGRKDVVVERALHDEQRHQADGLVAIEDLLRVALEDRLPRLEERRVVLDHRLALHFLGMLESGVRITDRRPHGDEAHRGVNLRRLR